MDKVRFGVIGSGWRSEFYLRIAQALPARFEVASVLFRNREKADAFQKRYGVSAAFSMEEMKNSRPDFVVVAVSKPDICRVIQECLDLDLPVLSETPPALEVEALEKLWRLHQQGKRLLVAEQYFLTPWYIARWELVSQGFLGKPDTMMLSDAHDYHAVSLIRRFLQVGFQPVSLSGEAFSNPIVRTGSRAGLDASGILHWPERTRLTFSFEEESRAFYDFSGEQYHSQIRSRHVAVQGPRGELYDKQLLYLDEKNHPISVELAASYCLSGYLESIRLGEEFLYRHPFEKTLPDDETGIALCLQGMKRYLETGEAFYPLAEALQDAYLSLLMSRAAASREAVIAEPRLWWNGENANIPE